MQAPRTESNPHRKRTVERPSRFGLNRLLLFAAYVVNVISVLAYSGHSTSSVEGVVYNFFEAAGMTLGAALPAFLLRLGLKRPGLWHGWTLSLSLLVAFGEHYGSYRDASRLVQPASLDASRSVQQASPEIQVILASQDADGITQDRMDMVFLKNLEAWTVERFKLRAGEFFASQGRPDAPLADITSEATYVETGPTKLAVIRLRSSAGSSQVFGLFVTGVVGTQLKRVACVRNSPGTIPLSYGPCGEKVTEVFGAKLGW